jgi:DNA-binding transcriptional regulator YhcF (GntR family)
MQQSGTILTLYNRRLKQEKGKQMEWNFKNGIPIYTQIVDELTMRIASGQYSPGDKLESVRDLAMDAGVNPNTMQRALAELERRGLVFSERTSGRFVTKDENTLKELHEELAGKYFEELTDKLRKIGMSGEEIASAVKKWLEGIR